MGIFAEDLINFGNLMEATIDFPINQKELENILGVSVYLEPHVMDVVVKKKFLAFSKDYKIRLKEGEYFINDRKAGKRAIGFDMLLEKDIELLPNAFEVIDGKPYINFWPYIKASELYAKVPNQFKERVIIKDYEIKSGNLVLKLGVQK
ncbi:MULTISPECIES: hypothetical protein [unclassified Hydrogenobaculum]|uniref:hypothetical protein n=1 Tax=unclassified Hydrogenobaculum TaxID=2622382 RepID=UPI0001C50DBB|nr:MULTISPECIES: hypothetical protein [unclassified Hydrogenobaculum]AEF19950.1 hypothetical protein Hyd3684_1574 [Hydrogenobaculum sp. 3684]AEG47235.1 hypothetical protein HydSHO_1578 [Hydrogenobaculum sp. SHO]AGG15884.1 hypothetical protein HydHO_1579 [Hydrogenobaculum sp. HO]AGH94184.1 hypothetical protein HydSN_1623 [Hydrogenobaculum sp. SN]